TDINTNYYQPRHFHQPIPIKQASPISINWSFLTMASQMAMKPERTNTAKKGEAPMEIQGVPDTNGLDEVHQRALRQRALRQPAPRQPAPETGAQAPDSAIDLSNDSPLSEFMDQGLTSIPKPKPGYATIVRDGYTVTYSLEQIAIMGRELSKARKAGLFPKTTAPEHNIRAIAEDYQSLCVLDNLRKDVDPSNWNKDEAIVSQLIETSRAINFRDEELMEMAEDQRVKALMNNMMEGVNEEARIHGVVKHAMGTSLKDFHGSVKEMFDVVRDAVEKLAKDKVHGVTESNLEAVFEDLFGIIDLALSQNNTEFSGRVKQMDSQIKDMNGQYQRVDSQIKDMNGQYQRVDSQIKDMNGQYQRVDSQIKDMNGQIIHLNAIGQHVNAIDGHVHSLGNNINAFGTLLNSTNGNVVAVTTQLGLLQTLLNLLPKMIEGVLREHLAQNLQTGLHPLVTILQAHGIALGDARAQKKSIKSFFKGIFQRFRKGGH
ncbi:hypothetical protein F5B19DRAFT_366211, partial [Rostrohypoxylon terebratum]